MKHCSLLLIIFYLMCGLGYSAQMNKVAAVVNGQPITMFDLQKEAFPELARARINPGDPARAKETNEVLRKVLDAMIMDILVAQEAKRLKVNVTPSEIDNEVTRIMRENKLNKNQFEQELARRKMTMARLRDTIQKSITRQKVMSVEVGRRVVVTPEEIKKYYDAHKDTMFKREGLHMGVLVYAPNVNAADIAAKIKSGAMTFEEACAKYSIAPNKERGGDQGPVEWDRLNPEWDGRLNAMKPGDVTPLFNLQGRKAQVHLFRPGGGDEQPLTLQQATPQIDSILRQPKAKGRFEDYSKQLRKKAVIDIRI